MTITVLPMDATAGAPAYTAQHARQSQAALYGNPTGRVFGTRSGWRVGTLSSIVSVTSTTWTLNPCACMIEPAAQLYQGAYGWASDQVITGSMTPADGTNPRIDILYIQVNDNSSGDGSGALSAPVSYLAGAPLPSGTQVAPALPPRSFLVANIAVPKSGGGSPTVTLNQQFFTAAGGVIPVVSQTDRDSNMTPYPGLEIFRLDLGWNERYTASGWRTVAPSIHQSLTSSDGTWGYNCQLITHYAATGEKYASFQFIVARIGGGAFTVNAGAWTGLFSNMIPAGYRPTDNVTVAGTYEFNGLGAALFKIGTDGTISTAGVTASFSCGTPTKLSASAVWKCA